MFKNLRSSWVHVTVFSLILSLFAFNPIAMAAGVLSFNKAPLATFNITTQATIDFELKLTGLEKADIKFEIKPEKSEYYYVGVKPFQNNTVNKFSWDGTFLGKDVTPGNYQAVFTGNGVDSFVFPFKVVDAEPKIILNDKIKIVPAQPTLTFNPTPSDTYTVGGGGYKVPVKLTGFKSETLVTVHIVDPLSAIDIPLQSFPYKSDNETHEFVIDMEPYKPGNYEMRIYGQDQNKVDTNTLIHKFKVLYGVSLQPLPENTVKPVVVDETKTTDPKTEDPNSCAGYIDLKKADWSCPAAEWAKAEGIITGVQEGGKLFFDGYSYMNRAQQAKIALMAYKKYEVSTDYCKDIKPFSDVLLNQWYSGYVCLGKTLKMITGYLSEPDSGKYLPAKPVTLPEMFCLLTRPLNEPLPAGPSYPGLEADQWYSGCAKFAKEGNYFSSNYILPTQPATRFNALNFLYALHQKGKI